MDRHGLRLPRAALVTLIAPYYPALQLLNSIPEDGDESELLMALLQIAKAFGGVQAVAQQAHLNTTQLYRTLSADGNPALSSFSAILKAMDGHASIGAAYASSNGTRLNQCAQELGDRLD